MKSLMRSTMFVVAVLNSQQVFSGDAFFIGGAIGFTNVDDGVTVTEDKGKIAWEASGRYYFFGAENNDSSMGFGVGLSWVNGGYESQIDATYGDINYSALMGGAFLGNKTKSGALLYIGLESSLTGTWDYQISNPALSTSGSDNFGAIGVVIGMTGVRERGDWSVDIYYRHYLSDDFLGESTLGELKVGMNYRL